MNDNKIHVTVTDLETRNAVTHRFDTWAEVIEFAKEQEKSDGDAHAVPAQPEN